MALNLKQLGQKPFVCDLCGKTVWLTFPRDSPPTTYTCIPCDNWFRRAWRNGEIG